MFRIVYLDEAYVSIDTQGAITPLSLLHAALDACQSNECEKLCSRTGCLLTAR